MNGGQVATRGFLLLTLMVILESFDSLEKIDTLQLEPNSVEEKTDILWLFKDGNKKAVQVKSSQNQLGLPDVKKWCASLKSDMTADQYELLLIGPASGPLAKTNYVDGVTVPIPKSLDIVGMIQQASHRLDNYFQRNYMGAVPPGIRELIVDGLIGKLITYSTAGTAISGNELETLFREWMLHVYPSAIQKALNQQVEIVCDSFMLVPKKDDERLYLLFPFTVLNDGMRPAVIEWIAVRLTTETGSWTYTPILLIDYTKFIQGDEAEISNSHTLSNFRPCVIRKSDVEELAVLFGPKAGQPVPDYARWRDMYFDVEVLVKYRGSDSPVSAWFLQQTIPGHAIDRCLNERKPAILVRREIDI